MSVGILLLTHRPLAGDLLRIASDILGGRPSAVEILEVINDTPCERVLADARRLADGLDAGDGVLVLTDLYGATPANIALALCECHPRIRALAGVNVPMLLKALNYANLDLNAVVDKALQGGRDGVRLCAPPE
ncbi:PTS sugar transporter subunit IIA [Thiocystis violacea]|uniref:PTS sugar transporter subunit IIA n=1 Tax=Thiocystis violacea TaxID=13725 RepID=UPI001908EC12|nr:PTS fructose transporter subunit IIA [Thiocystis violacea]MBK1721416.1 PTS fructose transporter subunit IIA [Thiocystis violacea]